LSKDTSLEAGDLAFAVWNNNISDKQKKSIDYISFKRGFLWAVKVCAYYSIDLEQMEAVKKFIRIGVKNDG
jgi:hypothetical protein